VRRRGSRREIPQPTARDAAQESSAAAEILRRPVAPALMAIMKKAALLLAPVLLGVATACAYPGCVERRDACGVYWYDSGAHTSWIPPGWIDGAELSANFTDESELVASPTDYRHLDFTAPRLLSMDPSEVWVAENRPRRCGWQIRCEGGQAAVLRFTAMNTEADVDFVSLSSQSVHTDSRNWSSPLVGVTREITHISGATVPAGVQFGASGGVLWVVFTSDGSVNGYGSFAAEYWCAAPDSVSCTDPAAVNYSPVATADDGSCMADLTVAPQTLMLTGSLRNPNEVYYFRLQPDLLNNRPHYQCARHNGTTSSSSSSSSGSCRWTNDVSVTLREVEVYCRASRFLTLPSCAWCSSYLRASATNRACARRERTQLTALACTSTGAMTTPRIAAAGFLTATSMRPQGITLLWIRRRSSCR
jgi:hypothetical protein